MGQSAYHCFMKHISLFFICAFICRSSLAGQVVIQYTVDIRQGFNPDAYIRISNTENRNNPFFPRQLCPVISRTVLYRDAIKEVLSVTYDMDKAGCFFLTDGYGRELLLSPGSEDTILINMAESKTVHVYSAALMDSVSLPWFSYLTFDKAHQYVGFFDTLAKSYGDLNVRMNYSFKTFGHNLDRYLAYAGKIHSDRLSFFNRFTGDFYFPDKLKRYAFKEIEYSYYDDLLDPMVLTGPQKQYPQSIIDSIKNISKDLNDTSLFENIALYRKVAEEYLFNVCNPRDSGYWDMAHLKSCYSYCEENLKGGIRDYFLALLLKEYFKADSKDSFQAIYTDYTRKYAGSPYRAAVDSMYEVYKKANTVDAIRPDEVLNLRFGDTQNNGIYFKDVISKDFVLIDCWATWCLPCREQIPFIDTLQRLYKDKVQFISLSADQDRAKWNNWILNDSSVNKDILQLHCPDAFDNLLFRKLQINFIPRFILISKTGKILNNNMPMPSLHLHEFQDEMNNALNK